MGSRTSTPSIGGWSTGTSNALRSRKWSLVRALPSMSIPTGCRYLSVRRGAAGNTGLCRGRRYAPPLMPAVMRSRSVVGVPKRIRCRTAEGSAGYLKPTRKKAGDAGTAHL